MNTCTHCHKPLGVSVIYDHGGRYHPDCYIEVARAKMLETAQKPTKPSWDMGLYET